MNIPFEMGYTFDENLREEPLSLAEMKQGIVFFERAFTGRIVIWKKLRINRCL